LHFLFMSLPLFRRHSGVYTCPNLPYSYTYLHLCYVNPSTVLWTYLSLCENTQWESPLYVLLSFLTWRDTINCNQVVKVLIQVKSFALFSKQTSNNRKDSALPTELALLSHRNGLVRAMMARAGRRGAARGLHACRILIRYSFHLFSCIT
jgi:hypothetical protein